jgi:DNA-binding response OmpR family regulator
VQEADNKARSKRILVVDDDRDTLEALSLVLELFDFQVRTADDGGSALRIAAEFEPGTIILDLGLPDLVGSEVARQIRRQHAPQPRIVAVTGLTASAQRTDAVAAGVDVYLVKPVDVLQLVAAIAGHPATARKRRPVS